MIARGFKSVIWVATVGTAAIACYMVSLKVATERADLARVEAQIIAAKQDIRSLQTELGTRGRLSQLEQWNADVLALSAPSSAQFLQSEVTLARFEQTDPTLDQRSAEVRMAAAEVPAPAPAEAAPALPVVTAAAPAPSAAPTVAIHRASFTPVKAEAKAPAVEPKKAPVKAEAQKPEPTKLAATAATKPAAKAEPKKPAAKPDAKVEPKKARASRLDSGLTAQIKAGAPQADGGN